LPYALVISEPVSVPAEINAAYRLADDATATNPEAERIELDADSGINIESAYQPRVAPVISISGRVLRST
jgi:hypothetical protein